METNTNYTKKQGTINTTIKEDMKCFDMLPVELRTVLNNSPIDYSAREILEVYTRNASVLITIERIEKSNKQILITN